MPTLMFIIDGEQVEVILTIDELVQFMHMVKKGRHVGSPSNRLTELIEAQKSKKVGEKPVDEPLPSVEDVKRYLLTKPEFRHSLFETQKHFFHRKFISRGPTKKMYHKTFRLMQEVRDQIENEQKGKFLTEVGENRINEYVFQKTPVVTIVEK